jgi:hypothetical protein
MVENDVFILFGTRFTYSLFEVLCLITVRRSNRSCLCSPEPLIRTGSSLKQIRRFMRSSCCVCVCVFFFLHFTL